MNCFAGFLADAAPVAGQTPAPTGLPGLLNSPVPMMILVGIIFYFLLIRPQQQRAKQQKKLLADLKAGDKVVTASGIIGTVITVKDSTVSLRSADAKFEVTKASVTEILRGSDSTDS